MNINPNIRSPDSAKIDAVTGTHKHLKSNNEVVNFWAQSVTIRYFPKDLHKFLHSLKGFIIYYCELQEIHQEDFASFPNLVYLRFQFNAIEIIEEDLFKYNPHLEFIELNEPRISHIDGNVFDHLIQLNYFWALQISCINRKIDSSRGGVVSVIKLVKSQCASLKFLEIELKVAILEIESESLNFEIFKANLDAFEISYNNSNFLKFRPLNERLANLKLIKNGSLNELSRNSDKLQPSVNKSASYDPEAPQCLAGNIDEVIKNLESSTNDLRTQQSELKTSIDECVINHSSNLNTIQSTLSQITSNLANINVTQARTSNDHEVLKSMASDLTVQFNDQKTKFETSQDELKGSISDVETSISNIKASQNDVKSSLMKLRTSQNEIKIALDELKTGSSEDKLAEFAEKLENFEQKLDDHFMKFEVRNAKKMEKELTNTRHKIAVNLDEKFKRIEKRLMSKFEEILEEKLRKIFKEKLENA